jgi:hypothetical protein
MGIWRILGMLIQRNNCFRATMCWPWEFEDKFTKESSKDVTRYKAQKFKLVPFIYPKSYCDYCFVLISYFFFTFMFALFSSEIDFQLCFSSCTELCMFIFFLCSFSGFFQLLLNKSGCFAGMPFVWSVSFLGSMLLEKWAQVQSCAVPRLL